MERLGSFGIVTLILSFVLGILSFYYIFKILINKKITFKFMTESLGDAATDKSMIAMICVILGIFGVSFFSICVGIVYYLYGV